MRFRGHQGCGLCLAVRVEDQSVSSLIWMVWELLLNVPTDPPNSVSWAVAEGLLPCVQFNKLAVLKCGLLQLSPHTNCKLIPGAVINLTLSHGRKSINKLN